MNNKPIKNPFWYVFGPLLVYWIVGICVSIGTACVLVIGNVDEFAKLLSEHWELSKKLDKGSTNTCIDQIFAVIEDLVDGKMICGAGGGGFLQVILKKNATKEMLEERLNNVFQDSGVNVWESEILW